MYIYVNILYFLYCEMKTSGFSKTWLGHRRAKFNAFISKKDSKTVIEGPMIKMSLSLNFHVFIILFVRWYIMILSGWYELLDGFSLKLFCWNTTMYMLHNIARTWNSWFKSHRARWEIRYCASGFSELHTTRKTRDLVT